MKNIRTCQLWNGIHESLLIDAHNVLEEKTIALAEAHLLDEGSTMRIIELEKRGQLAEAGAAHIVQESMEMRESISQN